MHSLLYWPLSVDEFNNMTIGWLLSRGHSLYRDIFSNHLPLDFFLPTLSAELFGGSFLAFRIIPFLVWAFIAVALHAWIRRRYPPEFWLACPLFVFLSAFWMPLWWGQMLLVENLWAPACVAITIIWGWPILGARLRASTRSVAASAGLWVVAASSTLVAVPACVLLSPSFSGLKKNLRRWAAVWALGTVGVLLFWCLSYASLGALWQQAVRFNFAYYPAAVGSRADSSVGGWIAGNVWDTLLFLIDMRFWTEPYAYWEAIIKAVWWGAAIYWAQQRRWGLAAWWILAMFTFRTRPTVFLAEAPFHSAPFFLMGTMLLSLALSAVLNRLARCKKMQWKILGLACLAGLLAPTLLSKPRRELHQPTYETGFMALRAISETIRRGTRIDDRIASFPTSPQIYLLSEREPAVPNVMYLPMQAQWTPQHNGTLDALRSAAPKVIFMQSETSCPELWTHYAADIEAWVRSRYQEYPLVYRFLRPTRFGGLQEGEVRIPGLLVRKDYFTIFSARQRVMEGGPKT
ncbi:MAG: hypothetical protein NTY77_15605 [Elusimicrobia bacterium]|nr:hypothetical protein [Elusimicrobiota bacterium]